MRTLYAFCILFLLGTSSAMAQTRGAYVEKIANEHSSFAVRVDVDHADRVYAKDDLLTATITSSEEGYLYLFYRDAVGNVSVLFPNQFNKNNRILKNAPVTVPSPESTFRIRIDKPFGEEMLKAVVSKKPLPFIDKFDFTRSDITPVAEESGEGIMKFMIATETPSWAEHHVNIRTVESPLPVPNSTKRFAVSIGVSNFKDNSISNLGVCHIDAKEMYGIFLERCGVERDNAILIENERATLSNIRKVFRDDLPRLTKPGDTVMVFWSGHGGQTTDGKKEFLVPYDGFADNIEGTMLMDKTFGRWIQELDSRKVLIILDACNSGGIAAQAKELSKSLNGELNWKPLRFALDHLTIAKNIGQKDAALIASSTATEASFVRLEKDSSVFTYYVLEAIKDAQKPLTHTQLTAAIKPKVAEYVKEKFGDKRQTVVMQDDMTEPFVLNP